MPEPSQDPQLARWARLDALLDAGLDVEPAARTAWLDGECAGDDALRCEVLDLLGKAAAPTEILEPVAFSNGPLLREVLAGPAAGGGSLGAEPGPGARIGAWRVLERLGEGGMGTVHRVERGDGAFDQQAALKLIRPGAWCADVARRLQFERQILADLNHPNIARLLDGGETADGRPYLVMELIDGRPIDDYCDRRRLSVDQRLELFGQVCRAVQHAHRALIVHRDLKPSNVVVDGAGKVTLLDFGIARALAPSGRRSEPLTRAVERVMTPDYASPEQVLGQAVTTATDVYQLGLLLFELLAGRRAQQIEGISPAVLERVVCATPAERPSAVAASDPEAARARGSTPKALARRLRGDLDGIVAVALRKEPERRYGSVAELWEDVERHVKGLPVRARPDSLGYRLRRFAGRHAQALAWATLCSILVAWAVIGSARDRIRVLREAERARQVEAVIGSLFEVPRVTDSGEAPQMSDFVDQAADLIREHLREQPASQASLFARLGKTYSALGQYRQAIETLEEALALAAPELAAPEADLARATLLYQLGRNQHFLGRFAAAEGSFREAARLRGEVYGEGDPRAVAVNLELADLLHSLGRLREAEELLEPAAIRLEAAPATAENLELRLRAYSYLGNVLRDRGLLDRAEAAFRVAAAAVPELLEPGHPLAVSVDLHFARLLAIRGRLDEAERRLEAPLAAMREVYSEGHPLIATALRELAFVAIEGGRLEVAADRLAGALQISAEWLDAEHPTIPRIRALEAELERRRGRHAEAAAVAKAALDHFARLGLRGHPSALDACVTLGLAGRELGVMEPASASHLADCQAAAERELVAGDPRVERLRRLAGGGS